MPATAPLFAPGTQLGVYEIVTMLGAGGMGAVYKARDTRLGRPVALKLLSSTVIPSAEVRSIFVREAKAISRLNHPHICTLYDIGHHGELDYLVMEFIAGETVKEQLERGRLAPQDVVRYGTQIAEALAEAHRCGLLHGDLKPGNIMVTTNGVKVLDFGLARPIDPVTPDDTSLAETPFNWQEPAGTVPYMSPEQLENGLSDFRSDIFSYGVLLYEMCSGRRPFTGTTMTALIAAILRCDPEPLAATGPGAQALRRVIRRCLVKDPEKRWQRIDEVAAVLNAVRAPGRKPSSRPSAPKTGVAAVRRLAVLPFENLSPDTLEEYIAEGLTDALTTALSSIRQLRVLSRTFSRRWRDQVINLDAVARMFGVNGVIRGVVSGSAERVQARVELVETATEAVLWSGTYDCPLNDVLSAQDDIAVTMAIALRLTLTPDQKRRRSTAWSKDSAANDVYLRGKYYLDRATLDGLRRSFQYLSSAVQKDPAHGRAFAALAEWYFCATPFRLVSRSEALPKSRDAALRAITLDPTLDEAHTSLGLIATLEWDLTRAIKEYEHARELNPNTVTAGRHLARCLSWLGRHQEAIALIDQVRELDPIAPKTQLAAAGVYYTAGQYQEAIEAARATLDLEPGSEPARYCLSMACHFAGQSEMAIQQLRQASAECPALLSGLAFVLARVGDAAAARRVIDEMKDHATTEELLSPYDFAEAFSGLGETDRALTYLERACDLRLLEMLGVAVDPAFQALSAEPRFRRIVRTIGLEAGRERLGE